MSEHLSLPKQHPPWELTGQAFILNYWLSPALLRSFSNCLSENGRLIHVLLIRYQATPVGAYDALVLIDHPIVTQQRVSTIPFIFVSTPESVEYGNKWWGLDKKLANFSWQDHDQQTSCEIEYQGQRVSLVLEQHKQSPLTYINSHQLPEAILNFRQLHQNQRYLFTPKFRGQVAKLKQVIWNAQSGLLPDLNQARYIQSFYCPSFKLWMPQALIQTK